MPRFQITFQAFLSFPNRRFLTSLSYRPTTPLKNVFYSDVWSTPNRNGDGERLEILGGNLNVDQNFRPSARACDAKGGLEHPVETQASTRQNADRTITKKQPGRHIDRKGHSMTGI
jgi:hypothetical protein